MSIGWTCGGLPVGKRIQACLFMRTTVLGSRSVRLHLDAPGKVARLHPILAAHHDVKVGFSPRHCFRLSDWWATLDSPADAFGFVDGRCGRGHDGVTGSELGSTYSLPVSSVHLQ